MALSLLRRQVGGDFTSADAARVLQTSARSAVRLLDEGIRSGALVRVGTGTRVRYRAVS